MTTRLVDDILDRQNNDPFSNLSDFTSFNNLSSIITDTSLLDTTSEYFLLRAQAVIGPANKVMYSVIHRDNGTGETQVLSRVYRTL